MAKKKNPNDTTFRNINALKKRVKNLEYAQEKLVEHIETVLDKVESVIATLRAV